ncbi:MAG: PEGA domain-containing protein [Myxococcales bacterium]|nr:PEGA domain-containing protein [Myxococcales bacterium]
MPVFWLVLWTFSWIPAALSAQDAAPAPASRSSYASVTVDGAAPSARRALFERRSRRLARDEGLVERPLLDEGAMGAPLPPERVEVFSRVAELLAEGTTLATGLREGDALARLSQAERLVREHADVPGACRWLAEVRTRIGVVALAASLDDLGRSALTDAATLDPSRALGSAEAPPAVVGEARRLALDVAARPTGRFQVLADGPFATVYLDDQLLGSAPAAVVAPVGRHVLRVESRGFLPWGRVIDVFEGVTSDLRVRLSPGPELRARRRLVDAARGAQVELLPAALADLPESAEPSQVWRLEVGAGPQSRALLTRCSRQGCSAPTLLSEGHPAYEPEYDSFSAGALAQARAWLAAPPPPPPPPVPLYRRAGLWIGVGGALVAASIAAALLTRPAPRQTLVVEPRPGDL